MAQKTRYSDFADRIDLDALEEALGLDIVANERGNDIGYCPWPENHKHGDTTGKFAIHREKRLYNCYICGGGDLLSLAMQVHDLDVEEATAWLTQFTTSQDQQSDEDFADYLLGMLEDVKERSARMSYFNPAVLHRFDGPRDYFYTRGISDQVCDELGLRFSFEVRKASPIKTTRDGTKVKTEEDYVGPASIWPHYWQGRLVGWQYRWHDWDHARSRVPMWLAKWTNTSDFPKSHTLYNYDRALLSQVASGPGFPIVVCESLGTVAFLRTHGWPAVAWFGSKPTDAQFRLLRRFQQGVILAPDNDSNNAGDKIYRAADYLERFIPVFIADKVRPEDVGAPADADGLDLGDYVTVEDPGQALHDHLKQRTQEVGIEL